MKTTIPFAALALATGAVLLLCSGPARAGHYEVTKNFKLQTEATAGLSVRSITFCHAYAFDKPKNAGPCECYEVQPPEQPAGFRPYRKTILAGYNSTVAMNEGTNADGSAQYVIVKTNWTEFGVGGDQVGFVAEADDCPSYAKAAASVKVDSFIGTNLVTGTVGVTGTNYVVKYNELHKSYAFSMAMIEVQGINVVKGEVTPGPILRKTAKGPRGPGGAQHQNDPVTFRVRNRLTGAVTRGTLFRFDVETLPGAFGEVSWESNRVHVGVRDLSFRLDVPGPYTTVAGHLQLEVRDGVVAQAEASGLFAGLLPPVGAVTPFDFPLDNDLAIAYDLTPIAGTNAEVALELATAGEVYEEFSADDAPPLSVTAVPGRRVAVSWPMRTPAAWQLQSTRVLAPNVPWSNVTVPPVFNEDQASVTLPAFGPAQFFRLQGVAMPCELSIAAQPLDAYAMPGVTMTWFVEAAGTPGMRYQWQRLGEHGQFLDIPGATAPTLTWLVTPLDQGAQFRCRVDNDCRTTTSLPAKLIVIGGEN